MPASVLAIARGPSVPSARSSLEAGDGFGLAIVGLEHRQQLRNRQEVVNTFRQVEKLELPVLAAHGRVATDDLAETCAVDGPVGWQKQRQEYGRNK